MIGGKGVTNLWHAGYAQEDSVKKIQFVNCTTSILDLVTRLFAFVL